MVSKTESDFPKGQVAKTLRQILYPKLSDHEVEGIVVALMSHLLIERRLNQVLYDWLRLDAPRPTDSDRKQEAEDELWKSITKMDFSKKVSLIYPYFSAHFPAEAPNLWKLNDLRNDIFHGRKPVADISFDEKSISTEEGIEKIFLKAQFTTKQLDKFSELVDSPHDISEKWADRLKALGQRLC